MIMLRFLEGKGGEGERGRGKGEEGKGWEHKWWFHKKKYIDKVSTFLDMGPTEMTKL